MEDHHHHHHPQVHQYSIPELRQLMNGGSGGGRLTPPPATHFPAAAIQSDLFGFNLAPAQPHRHHHQYNDQEMGFAPRGVHGFCADSLAGNNSNPYTNTTIGTTSGNYCGGRGGGGCGFSGFLDSGDSISFGNTGDGGGTGRWPRQETLTLLEIRSRLDHKFKEANQKGPLWDEVSRIMSEEHGYNRSGKKCREKFENLYKYYRKTKEGKAGRQDGKHYRFFRQLEALYGDSNNLVSCPETEFMTNTLHFHAPTSNINAPQNMSNQEALNSFHHHPLHQKLSIDNSLSLSNNYNLSELDNSSSDDNDSTTRRKRSWKVKIKEFIDVQMKRLIERQEAWLEKLTKTIEDKEQQRMLREEEWRRQEAARMDKEHKFWTKERERIEARDVAVIEALQCLTGRPLTKASSSSPEKRIGNEIHNHSENRNENESDQTMTNNACVKADMSWTESEITKLMEIRRSMDSGFQQVIGGCSEEFLWEEVSSKLARLGYDQRSALTCKEKWEWINNCMKKKNKEINKKRQDGSSRSCGVYYPRNSDDPIYSNQASGGYTDHEMNEQGHGGASPSNSDVGNASAMTSSCLQFFMGDGDQNLWESYGLRLSKGENQ